MSRLVQATCRYLFLVFGPGPDRIGVSSPQTTRAKMISARMVVFAAATAVAARASRACTHPSEGRVPDIDPRMSAHRSTGTWCITIKNTHQAWRFSPYVTVPGAPAASGGGSATWVWPHAHCTSCRSCWTVSACASGRSVTWWEYRTPRSRAPARFLPHPHAPSGKCGMVPSG